MEEWEIEFYGTFAEEFQSFSKEVRIELMASLELLGTLGPHLKRPHADTLKASKHSNMKELRFDADSGVWRVAFAFDPARKAILLIAGDKAGINQKRFYKQLIKKADRRFDEHLKILTEKENE